MVSSDEMNLYKIQKYVKDFDPINYNFLLLIWATALKAYYFAINILQNGVLFTFLGI